MFSREFCKIFKNTFLTTYLRTITSFVSEKSLYIEQGRHIKHQHSGWIPFLLAFYENFPNFCTKISLLKSFTNCDVISTIKELQKYFYQTFCLIFWICLLKAYWSMHQCKFSWGSRCMEKLIVVRSSDISQIRSQLNSAITKTRFRLH